MRGYTSGTGPSSGTVVSSIDVSSVRATGNVGGWPRSCGVCNRVADIELNGWAAADEGSGYCGGGATGNGGGATGNCGADLPAAEGSVLRCTTSGAVESCAIGGGMDAGD